MRGAHSGASDAHTSRPSSSWLGTTKSSPLGTTLQMSERISAYAACGSGFSSAIAISERTCRSFASDIW